MKSIYFILFAIILFSCSGDDASQDNSDTALVEQFSLVNVSGGVDGIDHDFELGLITWQFDNANWILTVENNHIDTDVFDGLPSGTYDYQILSTTGEDAYLVIHDMNFSYKMTSSPSIELLLDEALIANSYLLRFSSR